MTEKQESAAQRLWVLIPTRNRNEDLLQCLESLSRQSLPPDRILVVDSSDPAPAGRGREYAAAFPSLCIEHRAAAAAGLPRQRNEALSFVRDTVEFLMFLDDDVYLEPDYCARLVEALRAHPKWAGAGGRITNSEKSPFEDRFAFALRLFLIYSDEPGRFTRSGFFAPMWVKNIAGPFRTDFLEGGNVIYRRSAIAGMLFDTDFERCAPYGYLEDIDFSSRVARRGELWLVPAARLAHNRSPASRIGNKIFGKSQIVNRVLLFSKHAKSMEWKTPLLCWSLFGILGINFVLAFTRRGPERFFGNLSGLAVVIGDIIRPRRAHD